MTALITNTTVYTAGTTLEDKFVKDLLRNLNTINGIANIVVVNNELHIEYHDQLVNENYLKETLMNFDFPFDIPKEKKGFFGQLINKIAQDNKTEFGNSGPHCCG